MESKLNEPFQKDKFFEIAKAFPFGIRKIDSEFIVRDPLFIGEESSLICVGEVEKGSYVDILTGNKNMLISAVKKATNTALNEKKDGPVNFIFFIDCISRVLFLGDDFESEIREVHKYAPDIHLIGALTIGEIANNGKDYLEFYNKTSVIGCF